MPLKALRNMVKKCITNHVDQSHIDALRTVGEEERRQLVLFDKKLR